MSVATFVDSEEITFRQGLLVVGGWFALLGFVGLVVVLFT